MLADKYNGESVLITFDPHPRKVLYPDTAGKDLKLINSQEEKLELLKRAGLNNIIIIEFTRDFSKVTSEQFVRDFLHNMLHVKVIVVGFNHHFGFNKEGDYKQLWTWQGKYNFEAEEIPEQEVYHETVSSTRIRQAINEGYIQRANAYLDHYYIIMGKYEQLSNEKLSDMLPLVKIIITEECKILPPPGIYAVSVESGPVYSKGMVIIHSDTEGNIEVLLNIFNRSNFQPDHKLIIFFHKKIHGAVNLSESRSISKINFAKEEISELIY